MQEILDPIPKLHLIGRTERSNEHVCPCLTTAVVRMQQIRTTRYVQKVPTNFLLQIPSMNFLLSSLVITAEKKQGQVG